MIRGRELFMGTKEHEKLEKQAGLGVWYSLEEDQLFVVVRALRHRFYNNRYTVKETWIIEGGTSYAEQRGLPEDFEYIGALI